MRQRILAMGERLREAVALNDALLQAHDAGDLRAVERAWVRVDQAVGSFHVAAGSFDALLTRFLAMELEVPDVSI